MVYQFYIVEIHRNAAGEYEHVVHWAWDADYDKALAKGESKYYEVLSRAAVSEYVRHSAILFGTDGVPISYKCYDRSQTTQI